MIPDWLLTDEAAVEGYFERHNEHAIAVVDNADDVWLVFIGSQGDNVAQGVPTMDDEDGAGADQALGLLSAFAPQQWPLVVLQRPGVES